MFGSLVFMVSSQVMVKWSVGGGLPAQARFTRWWVRLATACLVTLTISLAQNVAGLSDRVVDAKGSGVDSIVSVSGPSALLRRTSTLPDGSFSMAGIPAGSYFVCAEATNGDSRD